MKSEVEMVIQGNDGYQYVDYDENHDEKLINMYCDAVKLSSKRLHSVDYIEDEETQFNRMVNRLLEMCEIDVDAKVKYVYWHDVKEIAVEQHVMVGLLDGTCIQIQVNAGLCVRYRRVNIGTDLCNCSKEGKIRSTIFKDFE